MYLYLKQVDRCSSENYMYKCFRRRGFFERILLYDVLLRLPYGTVVFCFRKKCTAHETDTYTHILVVVHTQALEWLRAAKHVCGEAHKEFLNIHTSTIDSSMYIF